MYYTRDTICTHPPTKKIKMGGKKLSSFLDFLLTINTMRIKGEEEEGSGSFF